MFHTPAHKQPAKTLADVIASTQAAESAPAPDLLSVASRLALATNEGDDAAQGTHYVDKQGRIRCKGSFLALIEDARAAIAKANSHAAAA